MPGEGSVQSGDSVETAAFQRASDDSWIERVADDFHDGQVLAEETGANDVITFTFASAVHLVVVESKGTDLVSRADPFGGTPAADLGIPCRDEVATYMPIATTSVKVWAPTGATVNCWGYRRT